MSDTLSKSQVQFDMPDTIDILRFATANVRPTIGHPNLSSPAMLLLDAKDHYLVTPVFVT